MKSLKIYTDKDINKDLIKSKKIAVIGFGSQGYGQGLNLKDSGCDVVIGVRQGGASDIKAKDYGLKTMSISDAVKQADIIQILIPDEVQAEVYEKEIKPYLKAGQYLMFSHGFNIHYGFIKAPENINVIMVAPKAPGHTVRSEYKEVVEFLHLLLLHRITAEILKKQLFLMPQQSALDVQELLKQRSEKKLKLIYLENRPYYAAAVLP